MRRYDVKKRSGILTAVLLLAVFLTGCAGTQKEKTIVSASQLNDSAYTIGVPQGSAAAQRAENTCPKAEFSYFSRDADAYLAVQQGRIDAFAYDRVMLEFAIGNGLEGVTILPENIGDSTDIVVGISPKTTIPNLTDLVNGFIQEMRDDGTLDDMYRRWVTQADSAMPQLPKPENPTLTLKVGTTGLVQPFSYYEGNRLTGHDIELIYRFAAWMNADVEIKTYDYGGIIAAAESGAIDCIMANLNATDERREQIAFSDVLYVSHTALLVQEERSGAADAAEVHAPLETADYGVMTGSTAEIFIGKTYPDAGISTYSSIADAFLALDNRKIDYVLTAYTTALNAIRNNSAFEIYQSNVIDEESSIAVSKENPQLLSDIDRVLERFREDGTLERVVANWTTQGQDYVVEDMPVSDGKNGVLRVAIAADREPMCFVLDGEYKGLDCELIERIAAELGMSVEYQNMAFGSLVAALASGKADVIISNMTATEERRQSVDFTQAYFANPQVLVSVKEETAAGTGFAAARYGIVSTTVQQWLEETYPQAEIFMYPAATDAFLALETGKVDYCIASRSITQYMGMLNPDITMVQDNVRDEACSIAVARSKPQLRDALDEALAALAADGTLDEMIDRWTTTAPDAYEPVEVPEAEGKAGVLRVAVSPDVTPICFVLDREYAGIDIELIERLAYTLDMKVEYLNMQFDALLPALESGKADVALSDIVDTPERRESVDFTASYFDNPQVISACQDSGAAFSASAQNAENAGEGKAAEGFVQKLAASFERTFITENRWKLILDGLAITVVISILSGLFGSAIGFGVCLLRRSKMRPVALLAAAFIRLIQGTPIVVFLMILYYVIFAPFRDISAVLVAVIGFSVNFGVYVSEMMRTGIDAVDKGQIEAATALGYNRVQAFRKVTFPQAARHFLPVFKGEFISMVKMTSVVGYIAVQDLTKVSDIIRSRTLEAFFPLIVTAVIYFVIANILTMALSLIEVRLDPRRRKGVLKGVETR